MGLCREVCLIALRGAHAGQSRALQAEGGRQAGAWRSPLGVGSECKGKVARCGAVVGGVGKGLPLVRLSLGR